MNGNLIDFTREFPTEKMTLSLGMSAVAVCKVGYLPGKVR